MFTDDIIQKKNVFSTVYFLKIESNSISFFPSSSDVHLYYNNDHIVC